MVQVRAKLRKNEGKRRWFLLGIDEVNVEQKIEDFQFSIGAVNVGYGIGLVKSWLIFISFSCPPPYVIGSSTFFS